MQLIRATASDAERILCLQQLAFAALLETYQDGDLNPANESPERIRQKLRQPETYYYFIEAEGETVGGIRVLVPPDHRQKLQQPETYYYFIKVDGETVGGIRVVVPGDHFPKRISPLYILPEFRGRGYAQQAIALAEQFHGSDHWSLDTILQEPGPCHLYEKMGYRKTGQTKVINDKMTLVFYEKENSL